MLTRSSNVQRRSAAVIIRRTTHRRSRSSSSRRRSRRDIACHGRVDRLSRVDGRAGVQQRLDDGNVARANRDEERLSAARTATRQLDAGAVCEIVRRLVAIERRRRRTGATLDRERERRRAGRVERASIHVDAELAQRIDQFDVAEQHGDVNRSEAVVAGAIDVAVRRTTQSPNVAHRAAAHRVEKELRRFAHNVDVLVCVRNARSLRTAALDRNTAVAAARAG